MKTILITSAALLCLALGIQTHVSGLLDADMPSKVLDYGKDSIPTLKRSIDLNTGIRMRYREVGNPKGRTILFIHGYTDTSRSFEKVMEALLEMNPDLRLIAPDLRGHGESSMPTLSDSNNFEMDDFADDILDFLKLKNITKVDLVGHSMGSVIAQEIAVEHPEKIASLTLIGALVNGKMNGAIQDFLIPEVTTSWQRQLMQRFGKDWRSKSYYLSPTVLGGQVKEFLKQQWVTEPGSEASLLEAIYAETINVPLGTWFGALQALAEMDNSEKMKRLKTPTLILWGAADELFVKVDQDRLLTACEDAYKRNGTPIYYRSYRGDGNGQNIPGHNLHWANAQKVASDILEFTTSESPFYNEIK